MHEWVNNNAYYLGIRADEGCLLGFSQPPPETENRAQPLHVGISKSQFVIKRGNLTGLWENESEDRQIPSIHESFKIYLDWIVSPLLDVVGYLSASRTVVGTLQALAC